MEIPVYLVNGFLESGKTTFIKETISDPEFVGDYKTLLILCEEGEEEFNKEELRKLNIELLFIEDEKDINETFLEKCRTQNKPDRIMIEYNGMWKTDTFLRLNLPKDFILAQIITIINAATYSTYLANMKSILLEQAKYSDLIIFNRCSNEINKMDLRRSIKPVNRKAQIMYEAIDGSIIDIGEEELPYDINADIIEINDDDYGMWFIDAMDHPKKYHGKIVRYTAMVYHSKKLPKNSFISGRPAMTCCADDIAFMGMLCKIDKDNIGPLSFLELKNKQFIEITAKICCEFYKEYRGKGPVLYAQAMKPVKEPEDPMVYFN